ncbi:hypothetical protein HMPREF3205_01393 [Streptococcus pasteurianus]|nr:hypothetical protein HMPREF9352_0971 [Streptococcus gallolyticus subsp. gallolyticus TX20005]KXI12252.1 hypothetical protein HMPREF3205_01393 [Streptococcus pasteurianus]
MQKKIKNSDDFARHFAFFHSFYCKFLKRYHCFTLNNQVIYFSNFSSIPT